MNKLYDRFEQKVLIGKPKLQWLFESLHRFSLRGMNYDQVQSIDKSGEVFVIHYVHDKLTKQRELILFDVGANVGEYSRILEAQFPSSRIYSFEALPSTFEILRANLQGHKNITYVNQALGALEEKRLIYSDGAGSGLSSFYPIEGETDKKLEVTSIPVTTIDLFCARHGIAQIDFLKIDVEGFELEVLKGAERMIQNRKISIIQFEFGSNHINSGTHLYSIFQYLSDYRISRVLKNGLRTYKQYHKEWEIYLAANYLAELR